jgi:hypothetical protein
LFSGENGGMSAGQGGEPLDVASLSENIKTLIIFHVLLDSHPWWCYHLGTVLKKK